MGISKEQSVSDTDIVNWLGAWHGNIGGQGEGYGDMGVHLVLPTSDGWVLDPEMLPNSPVFDDLREAVVHAITHGLG
jgi:hypothetical protein